MSSRSRDNSNRPALETYRRGSSNGGTNTSNRGGTTNRNIHNSNGLRRIVAAAGTATIVGLSMAAVFDFMESRAHGHESRLEAFGRTISTMFGVDLGIGRPGLSPDEIRRLPTRIFQTPHHSELRNNGDHPSATAAATATATATAPAAAGSGNVFRRKVLDDDKCAICQCEYEHGEQVTTLPCMHEFHGLCLKAWIDHHRDCPICRANIDVSSYFR